MNIIKTLNNNKHKIQPHIVLLGAALVAKSLICTAISLTKTFCRRQVDIVNRYGQGSYALITGGANGIGRQFALDLANKGFNLIIIDYKQSDLEAIQQEVLKINPNIMVKLMCLDFTQGVNPSFYESILQQVCNLDISILINNVGVGRGAFGQFHRIPIQLMLDAFKVNMYPTMMMTRILLQQMQLRNHKRSLILNLSSASALNEFPNFFLYGASKRFITVLMESIYLEERDQKHDNIDILTMTPGYISTAMINFKKGPFIIEPQQLVNSAWKQIGREFQSIGHWEHKLQCYVTHDLLGKGFSNWESGVSHKKPAELASSAAEGVQV